MSLSNVAGATLDSNNFNSTFTFLAGGGALGGNIALGSGNLTVNYGDITTQNYAGAISGTGGFIKGGARQFRPGPQRLQQQLHGRDHDQFRHARSELAWPTASLEQLDRRVRAARRAT